MSSHAAGFSSAPGVHGPRGDSRSAFERLGRYAHWLAPLLIAGLLGACTFIMFAARGTAVI
jgi:hypothetical protein